ncbi:MAG: hypothetical protein K9N34_10770, partial [Candidatus Marinimicrobia bacterium]|nr:hypothetical protein [Candidatus Neomarinimicrobiota bacterium]
PLFPLSPGLPVSRMVPLFLPIFLLLSLMTSCQEPEDKPAGPDTTSHYFNWTIDTIGVPGTYLHDVAVINENNIWVTGEIYTDEPDTFYNRPYSVYNAANWNGDEWNLHQFGFYSFCDTTRRPYPYPAKAIFVFSDSQFVVSRGGEILFIDGDKEVNEMCIEVGINAIWGPSIDNFWVAGRDGKIAHYDGEAFTVQATVDGGIQLLDLWGLDENHVWAAGSVNNLPDYGSALLEYQDGGWETKYYIDTTFDSLGFINWGCAIGDTLYLSTEKGVWKESLSTGEGVLIPDRVLDVGNWALGRIRATSYNDILLQVSGGTYRHWNGTSWQPVMVFNDYAPGQVYWMGNFVLKRDFALLTGGANGGGIVFRGYR